MCIPKWGHVPINTHTHSTPPSGASCHHNPVGVCISTGGPPRCWPKNDMEENSSGLATGLTQANRCDGLFRVHN